MPEKTDHPLLVHVDKDQVHHVYTAPTALVWDEDVWILQAISQKEGYPTDRMVVKRKHPSNGKSNAGQGFYVIAHLDETRAREKAENDPNLLDEPIKKTVREFFELVEEHFINGGFVYYSDGREKTHLFSGDDSLAYYNFSQQEPFVGTQLDYMRSVPKLPQLLKRGDMRKIAEELDALGIPMGIDIYVIEGKKGPRTIIDFSPRRAVETEEVPEFAVAIKNLKAGIAKGCTMIAHDPAPREIKAKPTNEKNSKVKDARFSESAAHGMVSFDLTRDDFAQGAKASVASTEEPKPNNVSDPFSVHLQDDSLYTVMTPLASEVLDQVLFVPRLKKAKDGFNYSEVTVKRAGSSVEMMDVFLHREEALKLCHTGPFEDEPDRLTVREILAIARTQNIGVNYHFRENEHGYRRKHRRDMVALESATRTIPPEVVKIYNDFVLNKTPVCDFRVDFIRRMPKAQGVLLREAHEHILESLAKLEDMAGDSAIGGDYDVYYIERLGEPTVVIDLSVDNELTPEQLEWFDAVGNALQRKLEVVDVGVLAFSVADEDIPKRADRDREPIFKDDVPIATIPALARLTRGLGRTEPPKQPFRLPGI